MACLLFYLHDVQKYSYDRHKVLGSSQVVRQHAVNVSSVGSTPTFPAKIVR
jgi:hypothetical protein